MEFCLRSKHPVSHLGGFALVVILHIAIVLGFMSGLARKPITSTPPAPIDWVPVIDPAPKPQPEPAKQKPLTHFQSTTNPLPALQDIQPVIMESAIVPVNVETTGGEGPANNTATASGNDMPSTPVGVACPNAQGIRATMRYPVQARREGIQGDVLARFQVGASGEIRNIEIVSSSSRALNGTVLSAVRQFSCIGQGRDVAVEVPFTFRLE